MHITIILLLKAICLVFVFEGILPFLSPTKWRHIVLSMAKKDDQALRKIGFMSMLVGLIVLIIIHLVLG